MKQIIMVLLCLVILISCEKNDDPILSAPTLTFGHYYGFCAGEECIEIFRINKTKIAEDTTDQYPGTEFYPGKFVDLSEDKFQQTKDILDAFPQELFNETDSIIGMPDAGDWGGYYIEYNDGIRHRSWLLDKMRDNVPTKYHPFMDKMDQKILLLQ